MHRRIFNMAATSITCAMFLAPAAYTQDLPSVEELVAGIKQVIEMCEGQDAMTLEEALREYWHVLGVRNMERLCEEDPELCAKMTAAELQAQKEFTE